MAARFPEISCEEIEKLAEKAVNRNTVKTTKTWMNVWKSWAESKRLNDDLVKYEAKELDECLSRFFAEIRKSNGSDYEPDSLRVMLATIDRHLKQNDSKITIAKDREFVKCRMRSWREKQELFAKKATENDLMQLKHLPPKMKISYGKIVYLANKIQSHSFILCGICSPFILVFEVAKSTMKCLLKISA